MSILKDHSSNMTTTELHSSYILASIYALRMFGIFLVLPVFSLYAQTLDGGHDATLVGLAFGIYGLTQALLQLPLGMASDYFGRKKIIILGLLIFALGSFLSAVAQDIILLIIARAIQGAGAVSAVVVALLADLTRDEVRTRAMALIGISICLTFSVSLILGPILSQWVGVPGIFVLTGLCILLTIIVVMFFLPTPNKLKKRDDATLSLKILPEVMRNKALWPLNLGIFSLHCAQMSLFVALPFILLQHFNLIKEAHWQIYLPVTLIGMFLMVPAVIIGEKKQKLKLILICAIIFLMLGQFLLGLIDHQLWLLLFALSMYFLGMNIAEAVLPSWVSKISTIHSKGTAMGVYNTMLSLGLFAGSLIGGVLVHQWGVSSVFYFNGLLMLIWMLVAILSRAPQAVKTLIFSLPETWQNEFDTLHSDLNQIIGIEEITFSEDGETLYLKVLQHGCDQVAIERIITRNYEYVSK